MANDNSGLLIAALVAIVAVVGLVILFKGGATGNAVCPPGQTAAPVPGTSSLMCTPASVQEDAMSAFDRPYGHSGAWRQYEYPGTLN